MFSLRSPLVPPDPLRFEPHRLSLAALMRLQFSKFLAIFEREGHRTYAKNLHEPAGHIFFSAPALQ